MKATGIVRRIDDLGRVVIPKEIRRTLRIHEGDPLEIFTDREGEVILKKYSPMGEMAVFARQYTESLAATLGNTVCVADQDQIIAAAGMGKKELQDKYITPQLERTLKEREMVTAKRGERQYVKLFEDDREEFEGQIIVPIVCEGDVIGGVVILDKEKNGKDGELKEKMALCAARFLGKQMEQ